LESLRQNKQIGKALEAKVTATGDEVLLSPIIKWQGDFKELLGVSDLVVTVDGAQGTAGVQFGFSRVDGDRQKCERCWHWETDIGQNAEHPTICGRCVEAVGQWKG
jgi:isoleucyl-tRNA synthetase